MKNAILRIMYASKSDSKLTIASPIYCKNVNDVKLAKANYNYPIREIFMELNLIQWRIQKYGLTF